MATLTMKDWRIEDKTPYFSLGACGENNARAVIIQIDDDELIEGAHYYLDIGDENGLWLPNTQEFELKTAIITKPVTKTVTRIITESVPVMVLNEETGEEEEQIQEVTTEVEEEVTENEDETIHLLYMKPLVKFLGREGIKLLQVRCQYIDDNQRDVTIESNVIHAVVDKNSGFVYKYDVAVFEQYLNKVRDLISKYESAISTVESVQFPNDEPKEIELTVNKYFKLTSDPEDASIDELTITLKEFTENGIVVPDYHFSFISGETPTVLNLPEDIVSDLIIEANKFYDVKISPYTNILTYQSKDIV